ncbi:MAG: Tim44-like domain-containing protein [Proteobacteria bacterium]|nr:Tim44-like domain-containing protein [Pseudomonadota bacterium]
MKRSLISLLALVLSIGFTLSSPDAEAKRLGGGTSSGMKRDSSVMKREAVPSTPSAPSPSVVPRPAAPTPVPAPAPSGMSRFLGPLAGVAAGIGIASLFSHFGMGGLGGMGEGFSSIIMMLLIGAAVFFLVRMVMNRKAAQTPSGGAEPLQYAGANAAPAQQSNFETLAPAGTSTPAASNVNIPPGFDVDGFVRQAKLNFVRLQAANDAGNMDDIRAFTTPEMFAEIQLEYQERGKAIQQTDVVQLNAGLLDVSTEAGRQIASVRFYGSIRETAAAAPEAFDEVWHLTRPADASSGWVIAGIQQLD